MRRRIALALLLVFTAGHATAAVHLAGAIHDHDAPCAACRVAGDHASAILPALPSNGVAADFAVIAPWAPSHTRSQAAPRSHPPRAPPLT